MRHRFTPARQRAGKWGEDVCACAQARAATSVFGNVEGGETSSQYIERQVGDDKEELRQVRSISNMTTPQVIPQSN